MKAAAIIIGLGLIFSITTTAAQMSGQGGMMKNPEGMTENHGGMGNQQYHDMSSQRSTQMMGHETMRGQMMNQDMMRNMHRMMNQMTPMVQTMSEHMNSTNMQDMSQVMGAMGDNMRDMSQYMAEGTMPDEDTAKRMQERMNLMNELMEKATAN